VSYWDLRNDPTCAFWAPLDGNLNDVRPGALNGTWTGTPASPVYGSGLFGRQALSCAGTGGAQFPQAAGGSAANRTLLFRFRPSNNAVGFGRTVWQDNESGERQWRNSYHTNGRFYSTLIGPGAATFSDEIVTLPAVLANNWIHFARRGGSGDNTAIINGTTTSGNNGVSSMRTAAYNLFVGRGTVSNNGAPGLYQDVAVFNRLLAYDEFLEYQAGPEPLYTVNPTASVVDGQLVGTTGTASAEGNGTVTYNVQWEQLLASQFDEVDSATSLTLASPVPGRVYRLRSEAANSGGKHRPAYSNLVSVVVSPNVIRQSLQPVRQQAYQQPTRVKTGYVTIRPSANYVTIGAD
jgi:hypothetical protein